MNSLWQDIRYGLRTLWKNPGFTLVAVLALGLGIGANTTIFSAVNALLLNPFPFRDTDRLYMVWETLPHAGVAQGSVAPANFFNLRNETRAFEAIAAYTGASYNLSGDETPERVEGARVSPQLFAVVGVEAALGRTFAPEEEQEGRDTVAVISDGLWRRRFGADERIVGRTATVDGRPVTVVGVMPADFELPRGGVELWMPLAFDTEGANARGRHYLRVLGRLKPGVSEEQVGGELSAVARRLAEEYPETNSERGLGIQSLVEYETRGPRPHLLIALGAVVFVLLIACANVANLLLLRAASRGREIAIRTALGASRWRIVRQLLTESLMLALAGGAAGLFLSVWGIDFISRAMPANFARFIFGWKNLGIDWNVFAYTLLLSLATGVIFGLAPALHASKANLNESLKEGGRSATEGRGQRRARSVLVIAEVALSLVLLAGAGLMIRSFIGMLSVDPGFNADNLLTLSTDLNPSNYEDPKRRTQFYEQVVKGVAALPGVEAAGAVSTIPMGMDDNATYFTVDGRPAPAQGRQPLANYHVATPEYFDAMGIPFISGRGLSAQDTAEMPRVAVVSALMAERHFPGEDPVGKRLFTGGKQPLEIVGVVRNVRHESFADIGDPERPTIYVPHAQQPWRQMILVVRAKGGDPTTLTPAVRGVVQGVDKDQPVFNVKTMRQTMAETMAPQRISSVLFIGFACIALCLAGVGIYAVISYSVAQRTHEIGVRMALGAQARDIFRLIIGQGMGVILVGLGLGLVGAFLVTRMMAAILYGVSATDLVTFSLISLVLALVAFVACFVPARRATKVDPMVALRYE